MDNHGEINLGDFVEIPKVNHTELCFINDTENDLNVDLEALRSVVPLLVPILFSIIIIIGFIGNILVVCVVLQNKNMRNTTNLLILNLAVRSRI